MAVIRNMGTDISNDRFGLNERTEYPYNIAAIRHLEELKFNSSVTFIIGENGAGKSTLVEAIAVCAGFNPEGGSTILTIGPTILIPICTRI